METASRIVELLDNGEKDNRDRLRVLKEVRRILIQREACERFGEFMKDAFSFSGESVVDRQKP